MMHCLAWTKREVFARCVGLQRAGAIEGCKARRI
jgi:hypothetical protein